MSFLKDFFDDILGPPVPKGSGGSTMWDNLAGNTETLNLNGVSNISSDPLSNRNDGSRRLPSEQLASIIQNRDRAFNRIDINPFLLDSRQYKAQVEPSRLYDLMGYESDNYSGGNGAVNANETPVVGWRTVEIAFAGSFLKFEFLPGLVNSNASAASDGFVDSNFNKPTYNMLGTSGDTLTGSSSNRMILIQFDDTSGPLLLARDGDVFRVPFERIFVTFKFNIPRFSLIVGYNAEIVSSGLHRQVNQRPSFGGGHGLWNSEDRHCVPFNFQTQGWNPADYTFAFQSLAANATLNTPIYDLEKNTSGGANDAPYGQAIGWITQISLAIHNTNPSATLIQGFYSLGICPSSTVVGANTFRKSLYFLPFVLTGQNIEHFNVEFNEPIRFTLNRRRGTNAVGCRLLSKLHNSAASTIALSYYFSVSGYIWGRDQETLSPSPMEAITVNAYPLDDY